jgi:hypothetical protein
MIARRKLTQEWGYNEYGILLCLTGVIGIVIYSLLDRDVISAIDAMSQSLVHKGRTRGA